VFPVCVGVFPTCDGVSTLAGFDTPSTELSTDG
jgi:hypothetical protein